MADSTALRVEAREWFEKHWDPDLTVAEWWVRLFEGGWAAPTWPEECYGRGLSGAQARIIREERDRVGATAGPGGLGVMLAGPTIVAHGTGAQKERYLPPLLKGEEAWCQLFSEPSAGSDLASLQCRADRDGDGWTVTGQKVWSSGAQFADFGMLLARTDFDAPKHKGITWFVIGMDQPGIETRPIKEMTGRALFNEVFLDDARVEPGTAVGDLGAGWTVANTTLAAERASLGGESDNAGGIPAGRKAGAMARRAGDLTHRTRGERSGTAMCLSGKLADDLIKLAQDRGRTADPVLRQELARLWTFERISRYTALRVRSAAKARRAAGPEVSTQKLGMSRQVRLARAIAFSVLGADGLLYGPDAPTKGVIQEMALFTPGPSIYGGSDEIQRNIIGERVLGLPREPRFDASGPFRELKVGTQPA